MGMGAVIIRSETVLTVGPLLYLPAQVALIAGERMSQRPLGFGESDKALSHTHLAKENQKATFQFLYEHVLSPETMKSSGPWAGFPARELMHTQGLAVNRDPHLWSK